MQASTKRLPRYFSAAIHAAAEQNCLIEQLESRTLLSAAWQTVDDFQLAAGQSAGGGEMTADPAGDVFAMGHARDASGLTHYLIREKLNGVAGWSTVVDLPYNFGNARVNSAGDIYVSTLSNATILERPAGGTTFNMVDQNPPIAGKHGQTTNDATVVGITIDAQKNVFVLEHVDQNWVVRKQTDGVGAFTTVNTYSSNIDASVGDVPMAITSVASGTAAGLYTIGGSGSFPSHSIVRRSTDGGTTWSTVDTFQYSTGNNGWITRAYAITGDNNGHVCITGPADTRTQTGGTKQHPTYSYVDYWLTREGVVDAGGNWSWTVVDAYPVLGGAAPDGVLLDASGNIFAVGFTNALDVNGFYVESATVRSNVGGTWQTDNYQLAAGQNSTYFRIAADAGGNVYAGGNALDSQNIGHWFVRSPVSATAPATVAAPISTLAAAAPASNFSSVPIAPSTDDSLLFSRPKDESIFAL